MMSLLASKTFLPGIGRHLGGEVALEVDRVDHRACPAACADVQVVLAEGRRDVDDAGALAELDELAAEHDGRRSRLSAKNGNSGS